MQLYRKRKFSLYNKRHPELNRGYITIWKLHIYTSIKNIFNTMRNLCFKTLKSPHLCNSNLLSIVAGNYLLHNGFPISEYCFKINVNTGE